MTLGDTRLTRTSAGTLTGERTEVTSVRGRALVGAAVCDAAQIQGLKPGKDIP